MYLGAGGDTEGNNEDDAEDAAEDDVHYISYGHLCLGPDHLRHTLVSGLSGICDPQAAGQCDDFCGHLGVGHIVDVATQ